MQRKTNDFHDYIIERKELLPKKNLHIFFIIGFTLLIGLCIVCYTNVIHEIGYKNGANAYAGQQHEEEKNRILLEIAVVDPKDEIDKVIEQVKKIEEWRGFIRYSDDDETIIALRRLILNMKAINTSQCPQEFRAAYEHCIQSYEKLLDLTLDAPTRDKNNIKEWDNNIKKCVEECKSKNAFADIEFVAEKYGAKERFSFIGLDNSLDWMVTWMTVKASLRANAQ